MRTRSINIQLIHVNDIEEVLPVTVSKSWIKRRKKMLEQVDNIDVKIRLEYDKEQAKYWLVDGINEYKAYKSLNQSLPIPCFISENTSEMKRILYILRNLVMTPNSRSIDKYTCITYIFDKCKDKNAIKLIQENTGLTEEEIQSFRFHPDTPKELQCDLYRNRIKLFNKIQELRKVKVKKEVRDALSYFAVQNETNRLTYDKLDVINWMIKKTDGFLDLPIDRQIALIPFAAKYEELLISQFQYFINSSTVNYYDRFIYTNHWDNNDDNLFLN